MPGWVAAQSAVKYAVSPIIEPTETSRLRVISTTACAQAAIARMAALEATMVRF